MGKARKECSLDGCSRIAVGRKWCDHHRMQYYKYGYPVPDPKPTREELFWSHVDKTETCWNWTGSVSKYGYGQFGKNADLAHRIAYALLVGDPNGLEIDHACRNQLCVRPDDRHCRLATRKQNSENIGITARNTSGVRGVSWSKRRNLWVASVKHHGKSYCAGFFASIDDAEQAVIKKRLELFTHNELDKNNLQETG